MSAVQLWEDVVGDSGKAPTDEELDAFYRAAKVEALRYVASGQGGLSAYMTVPLALVLYAQADDLERGDR